MSSTPRSEQAFSVEIYQDNKSEWRWTIHSLYNGKIIGASSEGFASKQSCVRNFKLMQDYLRDFRIEEEIISGCKPGYLFRCEFAYVRGLCDKLASGKGNVS